MAGELDLLGFKTILQSLDFVVIAKAAIDKTLDKIAERNVDQLRHGFTSVGTRLRPYAYKKYAQAKHELNPLPGLGNPDFILTGSFTSLLKADRSGETIGAHSYDSKAEKLENRDGADLIYGLGQDQHESYVNEDLEPAFMEQVYEALNQ